MAPVCSPVHGIDRMTSSFPSLSTILSEPEVARLVAEPGPWWLWTADASRLVAANLTGARAMGATGIGPALERSYSTSHAFAGQVARLAPILPADGTPRQERMRIAGRFGSESVTAEAFRLRAGETSLVAVRVPALRRGTPREAVLGFIADLRIPALAFTEAGHPLAASDASHPLANVPLRDLVGPAHEAVTGQIAAEGRAVVDLVNGPMTLVALPGTGVLMALPAPMTTAQPQTGLRVVAASAAVADQMATATDAAPADDVLSVTDPAEDGTAADASVIEAPPGETVAAREEPAAVPEALAPPLVSAAADPADADPVADATSDLTEMAEAADAALVAPQRFSWKMDGETRFHTIAPDDVAAVSGLTLAEAVARFGLDPDGALTRAVVAQRPFSGVPALWPLGEGRRRLSVTLAAFPAMRDGGFQGYAGFGLVVEEAAPAPKAPHATLMTAAMVAPETLISPETLIAPETQAAPADDIAAAGSTSRSAGQIPAEGTPDHGAPSAAPERHGPAAADALAADIQPAATTDSASVEAIAASADAAEAEEPAAITATTPVATPTADTPEAPRARIVAGDDAVPAEIPAADADAADLKAAEAPAEPRPATDPRPMLTVVTTPPNVVALRSTVGQDPKRPGLSPGERNAFREIARALGARTEDGAPEPETVASAPPAPLPPPAEQAREPVAEAHQAEPLDATADEVEPREAETDAVEANDAGLPVAQPVSAEPPLAPIAPEDTTPAALPEPVDPRPAAIIGAPSVSPAEPEAPAPAAPAFVDSGTPHGPLPSAFAAGLVDAPADTTALLDKVPAGLVVHRGNAVLFANRTLLDWIGFASTAELEEAGGVSRLFAGGPDDQAGAVTLTTRTGEAVAVDAHLSRIGWAGEPAFLFTLTRRVTEPQAEQESATLTELRGRLDEVEQILDTATDGIVIVNADASIESMNRSAEALFGYESAEVKGRSITALFAPESHRSALDYCDGLLSNGVASVLNDGRQIIGRVKQGGLIPLYMTMGRTGPAARPKLAAVFRDMTHWKKAEEDLIAAKRQAEQASSQKSDFLAKISHEIRTPLNAIIGFSEVMMEERFGPMGNERYRDYLKDIHASGGHVLSLINDLLDLSKIEAGKLELAFTSVDLNDMIQSSVAIMQPQANRERVIIRSSLQPRLPNVVADSRSLRQIVLNLLSNAVKFTPAGGQIIVSTGLSDLGEAVLRVRDTGIGMTETELKAAMEPFRQVLTANPRGTKGTGLGLPLTKALVEANRASFAISSTPNQGTLVEVVFPPTRVLAE
jgi:PAS domain S-box-containing protein